MDSGDVLHILIKDLTGSAVNIGLNDGDGNEEDTDLLGTTTSAPTTTALPPLMDKDGNVYTTVTIGTQEWIVENFRSETYADDSAIPNITDQTDWANDTTGAYCYYDNDEATYKGDYGALYNWYAVDNASGLVYLERSGVQEIGWRVPTLVDFQTLSTFIGGDAVAGAKLKEAGEVHWDVGNTGTDDYGFSLRGAGYRGSLVFGNILEFGDIWTSTEVDANNARYAHTSAYVDGLELTDVVNVEKYRGRIVRLVKDV